MKPKQVLWTDNHALFQEHGHQQPLSINHIKSLQGSIDMFGFLSSKPIQCYRDGKFLRIIDGHHRQAAAKNLGKGVYYIIVDSSEADLIGTINNTVRKWPMSAWINLYVKKGIGDYITLRQYMDRGLPMSIAGSVLAGESGGSNNFFKHIPAGTYRVRTQKIADEILRVRSELMPINEVAGATNFMKAISVLLHLPAFDADTLIQRIKANPRALEKCATREQMFIALEEIYNFRAREKLPFTFLAHEFLRQRKESVLNGTAKKQRKASK